MEQRAPASGALGGGRELDGLKHEASHWHVVRLRNNFLLLPEINLLKF